MTTFNVEPNSHYTTTEMYWAVLPWYYYICMWPRCPHHYVSAGSSEAASGSEQQQPLPPECACLVTCMLLRAAYGGLGGDVAMLKEFAALWAARCVPSGCSITQ